MQVSLKWINELIEITVDLEEIIEKLTLGGFEIEDVIKDKKNNVIGLEISATANRSDTLSIKGMAKEIVALLNVEYKTYKYSKSIKNWEKKFLNSSANTKSNNYCSDLIAITVENLTDLSSPQWLRNKLLSCDIEVENNLLDFRNFILLETGFPFEFYDLNKIDKKLNSLKFNLEIAKASDETLFISANNQECKLNKNVSIIKANDLTLGIAGIISHKDFAYTPNTQSLLIEGTIFNSKAIRQQSRLLGLRTERSGRYEKEVNKSYLYNSLYSLLGLLKISNPNITCKVHTISNAKKMEEAPIFLVYDHINEVLGPISTNLLNLEQTTYIQPVQISDYLSQLGFKYQFNKSNITWNVEIPELRSSDLTHEIDLIEEIGRLHGFNNFYTRIPKISKIGNEDDSYQIRKKITNCLLSAGLNELVEYSLVNPKTFLYNQVKLVNPLISDYSYLRISLLPNIIRTVEENVKQNNTYLEGFEYGHVFTNDKVNKFKEFEKIAGVFGGLKTKQSWANSSNNLSWFEGKGKVEQVFDKLNIQLYWKSTLLPEYNEILHPFRSATLYLPSGDLAGVFGQINPIISKKSNLSTDIYVFEFDFELIKNEIKNNKLPIFNEYTYYPKLTKDLSFIISQDITFEEIKKTLLQHGSEFLIQVKLLDEYKGFSIPLNHSSLCIQLVFQSNKKTLLSKEIECIIERLQSIIETKYNALTRI